MEAVCLDMDGVVDSERYWVEREETGIFPAAGVGDVPVAEITGMSHREAYDYLDERYGVEMERAAFLDLYEAAAREIYTERVALMDGLPALLDTLRERGHGTAIVSSSPPAWIELVRKRFGLAGFDAVVSAATVDRGKPAPDVYRHAAAELGVAPAACVAVEDSTHGVASATAAGMDCIGYRDAKRDGDADLPAADAVAVGPQELRTALLAR
jgi:HAD superfamily hydrolase (TIGR01509 family)